MLGLIGTKVGMTQVFDENGILTPVTVIKVEDNFVVGVRTEEKNGYSAHLIGSVDKKQSRVKKPYAGHFPEGIAPKRYILEIKDFEFDCKVGDKLDLSLFNETEYVDVIGTTKGKGYQGVVKRHGFGGGRKTHGSKFHRENGSTGQNSFPSKVFKGMRMAGRMGGVRNTTQNLRVVRVDSDQKLMLIRGAVPGIPSGMVVIRKAKKKQGQ
jgi:large subunit ribosomal protein L3